GDLWDLLCVCVYHTHAGVSQSPRHKVTKRGQNAVLRCDPISGHKGLYWYRQTPGQGPLELVTYFHSRCLNDDGGMPKDRFSAAMPETFSTLKIQPTAPGDSTVYLCATGLATVLQNHPVQMQKPWCFPSVSPSLSAVVLGCCPISGRVGVWWCT
uniref:Immunoglobulin V-set domain-containing protein n=1 Tax=Marmota marmota marmota TaxID=9994 RepID=A0A8C5Z4J8_MARMA